MLEEGANVRSVAGLIGVTLQTVERMAKFSAMALKKEVERTHPRGGIEN
jgi:site-specific recombinase XerD